jgi:hypothetical protein
VSLWVWIGLGVAALLALAFLLFVIAHYPSDNSF